MTLQKTNGYILYELKETIITSDIKEHHNNEWHYKNKSYHTCFLQYQRKNFT